MSEEEVRANFERYGLLDDQVRFLPGWFKDTLPDAPIDRIAVLRLDGDLYESTIQALDALYPRLSPGGFCIIDDYQCIEGMWSKPSRTIVRNMEYPRTIFEIDESGPVASSQPQPASVVVGQRGTRTGMRGYIQDQRELFSSGRCGGVLWRKE